MFLDCIRFREILEIIYISPKVEWGLVFEYRTSEYAGVVSTWKQSNGKEGVLESIVPVKRAPSKTV
jgi:hypothetical protein